MSLSQDEVSRVNRYTGLGESCLNYNYRIIIIILIQHLLNCTLCFPVKLNIGLSMSIFCFKINIIYIIKSKQP